ncbi:glycoside hydrolase family 9 protein [Ruminiclostridium cellobioparum]|uniref:glycoside hydrolase family 9 protein n=1 Tax=Ruminiclostridium cellobioparum TaxID=29355 RepID=UPI0028ABCEF5|nr:glycoside hydrolase family 9 protein [Ruminiclostridium cellobioparum]
MTKGKLIDVSGGWYDAADYIKFMSTMGYCSNIMLSTYLNDSGQYKDPARGILAETKVRPDFMVKMWDNENQVLYLSVADADEHGGEDIWKKQSCNHVRQGRRLFKHKSQLVKMLSLCEL